MAKSSHFSAKGFMLTTFLIQKEGIVLILNRKHSRSNKKMISLVFTFQHIFSLYHLQIIGPQTTLIYLDKASFTRHDSGGNFQLKY